MAKRKSKGGGSVETKDDKYARYHYDNLINEFQKEAVHPHEIIDSVYEDTRKALDQEMNLVHDIVLQQGVLQNKTLEEMELTNLLYEKE